MFNFILYLLLFIILISIPSLILIILIKEFFSRPILLKKVAGKYGLSYKLNADFFSTGGKRNVLQGKIKNKKVVIYDTVDKAYKIGERGTYIKIGSKQKKYTGKISGYYPVNSIVKIIDNLL